MDLNKAQEVFGEVAYETEYFQVRAKQEEDGMHVYSFRKNLKGEVEIPRGFIIGSNSLHHKLAR